MVWSWYDVYYKYCKRLKFLQMSLTDCLSFSFQWFKYGNWQYCMYFVYNVVKLVPLM